jgi:hypothetical protein
MPATTTTTTAAILPAGRVPSAANPLRVWIQGDSVMHDGSLGIAAALEATNQVKVVANETFGGWGLSTYRDWPVEALKIVDHYHPEVIVATWSWDGKMALHDPAGYVAMLREVFSLLLSPRGGVSLIVLLQFPQVGPVPYADPARMLAEWAEMVTNNTAWDRAAEAALSFFPGHARYISTDAVFAPGGNFYTWHRTLSGAWIRARKVDNVHLCPYGAAELGALVAAELVPDVHLGPMWPGWETEAWVHDGRYNRPPGACPADQPPAKYAGIALPVPAETPSTGPEPAPRSLASGPSG